MSVLVTPSTAAGFSQSAISWLPSFCAFPSAALSAVSCSSSSLVFRLVFPLLVIVCVALHRARNAYERQRVDKVQARLSDLVW